MGLLIPESFLLFSASLQGSGGLPLHWLMQLSKWPENDANEKKKTKWKTNSGVLVTCQINIRPVKREGKEKTGEGVSFLKSGTCEVGSSELCDIFQVIRTWVKLWSKSKRKKPNLLKT